LYSAYKSKESLGARGVGNNDVGALLQQVVTISNVFNMGARLFKSVVVYNGGKRRTGGEV